MAFLTASRKNSKLKIQLVFTILLLLLGIVGIGLYPLDLQVKAKENQAGTSFAGGTGKSGDPWQIETPEQLDRIREDLTAHYILTEDIDLDQAPFNSGKGFAPIGKKPAVIKPDDPSTEFSGSLDGNGYTISNLMINRPNTDNVGLFGYAINDEEMKFKNLRLVDAQVKGKDAVGTLIGYFEGYHSGVNRTRPILENSSAKGQVKGTGNMVGGLVGKTKNVNLQANNFFVGQVEGEGNVGGMIGRASGYLDIGPAYVRAEVTAHSHPDEVEVEKTGAGLFTGTTPKTRTIYREIYVVGSIQGPNSGGFAGLIRHSSDTFDDVYFPQGKNFYGELVGDNLEGYNSGAHWEWEEGGTIWGGTTSVDPESLKGKQAPSKLQGFDFPSGTNPEGTWLALESNFPVLFSQAGEKTTLEGTVTCAVYQNPVESAKLTAIPHDLTLPEQEVFTDSDGLYTFQGDKGLFSLARYHLVLEHEDALESLTETLSPAEFEELDFSLELVKLEEEDNDDDEDDDVDEDEEKDDDSDNQDSEDSEDNDNHDNDCDNDDEQDKENEEIDEPENGNDNENEDENENEEDQDKEDEEDQENNNDNQDNNKDTDEGQNNGDDEDDVDEDEEKDDDSDNQDNEDKDNHNNDCDNDNEKDNDDQQDKEDEEIDKPENSDENKNGDGNEDDQEDNNDDQDNNKDTEETTENPDSNDRSTRERNTGRSPETAKEAKTNKETDNSQNDEVLYEKYLIEYMDEYIDDYIHERASVTLNGKVYSLFDLAELGLTQNSVDAPSLNVNLMPDLLGEKLARIEGKTNPKNNKLKLTLSTADLKSFVITLTGDTIQKLEEQDFQLIIKTDTLEYQLPAGLIDLDKLKLEDDQKWKLKINVEKEGVFHKEVELNKSYNEIFNNYDIISPPGQIDFTLKLDPPRLPVDTLLMPETEFSDFATTIFHLPQCFEPTGITMGLVKTPAGNYRHIPVTLVLEEHGWQAEMISKGNTSYVIVNYPNLLTLSELARQSPWTQEPFLNLTFGFILQKDNNFSGANPLGGRFVNYGLVKALID